MCIVCVINVLVIIYRMEEERDSKRNESHVEKVLVNDIEADANGLTGNQDEVDVFGSTL